MKQLWTVFLLIVILLSPLSFFISDIDNVQAASVQYSGYPTFTIASVVRDKSVTINIINLPPNDVFLVRMGYMGTRGINGIKIKSFESGAGGSKTLTFAIPSQLYGLYQVAIRIESKTGSGYYAYNWFYNNSTTSKGGTTSSGGEYSGYPTFRITKVVKNTSVSIVTNNLPADDTFRVRMGYMGTRGLNGLIGKSFSTGNGGTQTLSFTIPSKLHGLRLIAIRIESTSGSGYYAYNWFYNNTYP